MNIETKEKHKTWYLQKQRKLKIIDNGSACSRINMPKYAETHLTGSWAEVDLKCLA